MGYDRSSVEAVVQGYFDALYEGDADKLGAVFHPSADLRWVEKGELKIDWNDEVFAQSCLTHGGQIKHEPTRKAVEG